jgi:Raf kinase inhibitor-like YbhB/YbcL family protein
MPGTRVRRSPGTVTLAVTTPAFQDGERIPDRCARGGRNLSPALNWSELPDETASVALICEDPDAPTLKPFVHWVIFNLSPSLPGLPEGVPHGPAPDGLAGAAQGVNDFDGVGYDGPAPPAGTGPHRYRFQMFALSRKLGLPSGASASALRRAMDGHVIGKGVIAGIYSR